MNPMYGWLTAGILFLAIEALGVPGVGMLFAGLGAIATGVFIYFGSIAATDTITQFVCFFAASGLAAAILWKPLKRFRIGKQDQKFNNMVGDTGTVSKTVSKDGGEVKWSGTQMHARLSVEAGVDSLAPEAKVIITAVEGATLIVKPK